MGLRVETLGLGVGLENGAFGNFDCDLFVLLIEEVDYDVKGFGDNLVLDAG